MLRNRLAHCLILVVLYMVSMVVAKRVNSSQLLITSSNTISLLQELTRRCRCKIYLHQPNC